MCSYCAVAPGRRSSHLAISPSGERLRPHCLMPFATVVGITSSARLYEGPGGGGGYLCPVFKYTLAGNSSQGS
jgi:hypothetical protein